MKISISDYSELKKQLKNLDLNQISDWETLLLLGVLCMTILEKPNTPEQDIPFWEGLRKEVKQRFLNLMPSTTVIQVKSISELIKKFTPVMGKENIAEVICSFPHWELLTDKDMAVINEFYCSLPAGALSDKLFALLCQERCRRNPNLN